jgi:hypothetical protein
VVGAKTMRNPFRHRYIITVVGQESGVENPLSFVTFRRWDKAQAWVDKMNYHKSWVEKGKPLTVFEVRDLP